MAQVSTIKKVINPESVGRGKEDILPLAERSKRKKEEAMPATIYTDVMTPALMLMPELHAQLSLQCYSQNCDTVVAKNVGKQKEGLRRLSIDSFEKKDVPDIADKRKAANALHHSRAPDHKKNIIFHDDKKIMNDIKVVQNRVSLTNKMTSHETIVNKVIDKSTVEKNPPTGETGISTRLDEARVGERLVKTGPAERLGESGTAERVRETRTAEDLEGMRYQPESLMQSMVKNSLSAPMPSTMVQEAAKPVLITSPMTHPTSQLSESSTNQLTYSFKQWGQRHHVTVQMQQSQQHHPEAILLQPSDGVVQQRLSDYSDQSGHKEHWVVLREKDQESEQRNRNNSQQSQDDEEKS